MKKFVLHAICIVMAMTSCSKGKGGDVTSATEEKGYATGKVVDTKGNPLANVNITIENVLPGASNSHLGKTDANGLYRIKVGIVGAYRASAYHDVVYNGVTYSLPMHSDNDETFSNEGAVRNFQWKLSGPMHSGGRYGSSIILNSDVNFYIDDPENIEYTLTPVGKLIDGSDGKELTMRPGPPNTESYGKLLDIPIGRYTLSAVYLNRGARKPLRLKLTQDYEGAYKGSLEINFPAFFYEGVGVLFNE